MTEQSALDAAQAASLAKTLSDTGFERISHLPGGWVVGTSYTSSLVVFVRRAGEGIQLVIDDLAILTAVMQEIASTSIGFAEVPAPPHAAMIAEVDTYSVPTMQSLPMAEVASLQVLHEALAAAFRATRGTGLLPPLQAFSVATAKLPKATEAERLVVQRVGQDLFRQSLLKRWEQRCPMTGINMPDLLRASHIKPWADCSTDEERLDPDNGILLAVQWDAAFDRGFVSFEPSGAVIWSASMTPALREALGLRPDRLLPVTPAMACYLDWHREHVLRN